MSRLLFAGTHDAADPEQLQCAARTPPPGQYRHSAFD